MLIDISGAGTVRYQVLGPLRVWDGTAYVPVRAAQQRVVLAVLLAEPGRVVPAGRLIDEVWGGQPPQAAASVLRGYVMRLRRQLGGGRNGPLITANTGYSLLAAPDEVDASVFTELVALGRRAIESEDASAAAVALTDAVALWRGPALSDVPATPTVSAQARRWDQARLAACEDLISARIEVGQHADVVEELHRLVDEHPTRERLWSSLLLALYRCGRRGEALDMFRRARATLAEELGVEPGRELNDLHQMVLAGGQDSITAPPVPAQLPPDLVGFVGRQDYLDRLDATITGPEQTGVICLAGTAGVGKTALAVHWAHRVAHRFPDGQLYVDLRGYDPSGTVMSPAEAVRGFLDALRVTPERIPIDISAQVGLYRSLLNGRRMLVVLDNARDANQVRSLLPSAPGCLVVVSSRTELSGLVVAGGACLLTLDLMPAVEARQLLIRRIGAERTEVASEAVDEIVRRCARLPLALAIVAARAATRPGFSLDVLVDELREGSGGLDALAAGDAADARAVFSWSYQTLSPPAARLFRLLALHPGPDILVLVSASLAGVNPAAVRPMLAELARANLLTEYLPGRYSCHDLLRAYATELVDTMDAEDDRRAARLRMLAYLLHAATVAGQLIGPQELGGLEGPGATVDGVRDQAEAREWFVTHRRLLVDATLAATGPDLDGYSCRLAHALEGYLVRQGHWQEQASVQSVALAAARRLGDRAAQAQAHRGLGNAYARQGRYDGARLHYGLALELFSAGDDKAGTARTHAHLGWLLGREGSHAEALDHKLQALELYRVAGDRPGQGRVYNQIGWSYVVLGEHEQALVHCRRAIDLLGEVGDRHGQGLAWDTLGYAYHHLGRHDQAAEGYQRALELHREVGDRYNEAETLIHLGDTHQTTGSVDAARRAWAEGLGILDELHHPDADTIRTRLESAQA